jgi:hypothetical protein
MSTHGVKNSAAGMRCAGRGRIGLELPEESGKRSGVLSEKMRNNTPARRSAGLILFPGRSESRACYSLSRGRRCERKSGQTRPTPDFRPSDKDLSPGFLPKPFGVGPSATGAKVNNRL